MTPVTGTVPYLLPSLAEPTGRPAMRIGDRTVSNRELAAAAARALSAPLSSTSRVAVWATATVETVVAVVTGLLAGVPVVPLNPRAGKRELAHILTDADPDLVLSGPGADLPAAVRDPAGLVVDASADRPAPAGTPLPSTRIRLVDDDARMITASDDETIGEIAVREPNLFLGYLNRPDATAEVMRDGWFHTGDLGTRVPDAPRHCGAHSRRHARRRQRRVGRACRHRPGDRRPLRLDRGRHRTGDDPGDRAGGSGGAFALASPERLWITQDGYFSVIAPRAAAAILKRDEAEVPALAGQLRLRPQDLFHDGLVRGIAGAAVTVADPLP